MNPTSDSCRAQPPARRFGAAALLLLALLLQACSTLPERSQPAVSRAVVDHDSALARIVQASWPGAGAGGAAQPATDIGDSGFRLLPTADHAFSARIELAARSQRTLDAQYYHLHADSAGASFLRALADAARRGVRVRLLVDDLHVVPVMPWLRMLAAQPNIEVRLFNPIPKRRGPALMRLLGSADDFDRANRRMHNKLFIADNAMALFGGRNIGDEYFARGGQANFVDIDVLGAGRVAQDLSRAFDRYWNSEHAWPLADLEPVPADAAAARARFEQDTGAFPADPPPSERDPLGAPPLSVQLASGRLPLVWADAAVFADPPSKVAAQPGGPSIGEPSTAMRGQLELIEAASSEVVIVNPYFVPNEPALELMRESRRRGVRGVVITNSLGSTDEPLVYFYYSRKRTEMLRLGTELYELSPTLPQRTQSLGAFGRSMARLHAKGGVIDRRWLLVGSVNLDQRSALLNTELGVAIDSPELARQALALITGERFLNMYRVTLDADRRTVRWRWTDIDGTERESTESPHFDGWLWLKLQLQSIFVSEQLM